MQSSLPREEGKAKAVDFKGGERITFAKILRLAA